MWSDKMIVCDPVLHDGIIAINIPIGQVLAPNMKIETSIEGHGKIGIPMAF